MSTDTLLPHASAALAPQADTAATVKPVGRSGALFLVSVLGLFLELMLIRWIGTEVRIFAYLQNTVLVVCFLGLGMGCWTCRRPFVLRAVVAPLFLLGLLLAVPFTRSWLGGISEMLASFGGVTIWYEAVSAHPFKTLLRGLFGLGTTFGLMVLIWATFVPIGRLLGRLLSDHPHTIWAYSVNVAGSLAGIWLFVLLSVLYQPPAVWMAVVAILLLCFAKEEGRPKWLDLGLVVGLVGLAWLAGFESDSREVRWSPYQKLSLRDGNPERVDAATFIVGVNNVGYQVMLDLAEGRTRQDARRFPPETQGLSQYDLPALLHPDPQCLLIVGAGSGNDAAGALRHGVPHIVAVEIDPAIIDLGRSHHPERPYHNGAVEVVNDDARSYFASAPKHSFDVISFGLLDSHTTTAMTNSRLDHYVYTRESLQRARQLLKPGGVMVLSFEAQKPFIADRMAAALREVFDGQEPLCFRMPFTAAGWGGVLFVTGDLDTVHRQIDANPRLRAAIDRWQQENPVPLTYTTAIATDNWPYIYLANAHIPLLYYCLGGMLLLLLGLGLWRLQLTSLGTDWGRPHWHFFFLGAAFMLLETQNISKAAVALGNTWWVNAVIISSILCLILVANLVAARWPNLPLVAVYVLLVGSCLGLYFVDIAQFAFLPFVAKAALVGVLTSLPMLFSGIVFIRSFAAVEGKDRALAANLIGALVGGLLQSITFVTGIQALLLLVAGLYLAAVLTRPGRTDATTGYLYPEMA